jgi:radical SAM protein with 4Fe4S-binding SPASM domain
MRWRTLRDVVDLLLRSPREDVQLVFSGGEPLLHPRLVRRAIRYAVRACPDGKRVRFALLTNGTLLDGDMMGFLAAANVETQVSFDGVPAAQRYRAPWTFTRLDALLREARRRHPPWWCTSLRVAITVHAANVATLADSIAYFIERDVRNIAIAPRETHDPAWTRSSSSELRRQFASVFELSLGHFGRTGQVPVLALRRGTGLAPPLPRRGPLCGVAQCRNLTVAPDGNVYGCERLVGSLQEAPPAPWRDVVQALRLGNVASPRLDERIARLPAAAAHSRILTGRGRKHTAHRACAVCRFLPQCTLCPASIGLGDANGDPDFVPENVCAFSSTILAARERFPAYDDRAAFARRLAFEPAGMRALRESARAPH